MPDEAADRQADQYWNHLVTRARQTEQNAQAFSITEQPAATNQQRPDLQAVQRQTLGM